MKQKKQHIKPAILVKRVFVQNNTVYVCNESKIATPIQLTWSPVTL